MFGLLRDVHFAVFCGTAVNGVWVPVCHIAPFPGGVKMAVSRCRWGSRHGSSVDLTVGGTGNMHRGILRLSRIEESKICRTFRCRVIDDRKKAPWQFCVGGCSLFVKTASG